MDFEDNRELLDGDGLFFFLFEALTDDDDDDDDGTDDAIVLLTVGVVLDAAPRLLASGVVDLDESTFCFFRTEDDADSGLLTPFPEVLLEVCLELPFIRGLDGVDVLGASFSELLVSKSVSPV